MRVSVANLGWLLVWLVAIWPALLWAVQLDSPAAAVQLATVAASWLWRLLLGGAALAALAALLYPPFLPGIRHGLHKLGDRLRSDRIPLRRAQSELRNFETAARQLEAGRTALLCGDHKTALPHLRRAVELEPDSAAAHHQLGLALLRSDDAAGARAAFAAAVDRQAGHAFGDALLQLGRACLLTGDLAAAAATLLRHSREHGGNRKSHYWLGLACAGIGDAAAARAAFAVAAAPPPRRPRLTAEESWFRARARVALWRRGGRP